MTEQPRRLAVLAGLHPAVAAELQLLLADRNTDAYVCSLPMTATAVDRLAPDIVVLSSIDPTEVERLRETYQGALILAGSPLDSATVVALIESGADDYCVDTRALELGARITSLLRGREISATTLRVGDVLLDRRRHTLTSSDTTLFLSPIEFRLIEVLARNRDRVVHHQDLVDTAWRARAATDHVRSVAICRLRRKLRVFPGIELATIPGVGYTLRVLTPQTP